MTKISTESLKKVFYNAKKTALRNIFRHFFLANCFMFVLLISNQTGFLVQFEINLHLRVFKKAELVLAEAARAISVFLKNSLVQINSKLNSKPYDYLYE